MVISDMKIKTWILSWFASLPVCARHLCVCAQVPLGLI